MIELELGESDHILPPSWAQTAKVKDVGSWKNRCATDVKSHRVVRQADERYWLGDRRGHYLISLAWRGCNGFEAPAEKE